MSGKTWPGETMSAASFVGSIAVAMVRARSCAEMPVEMPSRASIDCVKAVRLRGALRRNHRLQAQIVRSRLRERQTYEPAAVLGHEVDGVRRRHLRGDDEIALVLALLRVDEHDHAPVAHVLEDLGDGGQAAAALRDGDCADFMASRAELQEPRDVARKQVDLQVDRLSGGFGPPSRHRQGVRDEVDRQNGCRSPR